MLEIDIGEIVVENEIEIGDIEIDVEKAYPPLEDLEVTPSNKEQIFKSKEYGFNEVRVKKVEGEELNIIPSAEEQVKEGLYEKVTVAGESNFKEENIRAGTTIWGKTGTAEMEDEEITASYLSLLDDSLGANVKKLPNNLTEIRSYAFYGCKNLNITELPESVTTINTYAFHGCSILNLSKLPSNLKDINSYAFYNCVNLKVTEVPEGITIIKDQIFRNCGELTELTLKGNITSILRYAFYWCSKLEKIVLPNITAVPTLAGTNVFEQTLIASGKGYIYVPDNLVESFKTATNWSTYASQIKGVSEMEG